MRRLEADVCVVGAGFAGLMAARRLGEAGKHVVVLEARDRVGGRVHTVTEAGAVLDLGGQWVGPTQDRINGLAAEIGARSFVTYGEGSHLYLARAARAAAREEAGKLKRFTGTIPPLDPWSLAWLGYGWAELDRRAKKVPLDAPWTAPRAREWDGETVASFLARHVRAEPARRMFRIAIEAVFACDPEDLSLLHALFYIHSAGKLDLLLSTEAGAQRDRFVLGMQPVAEALAKRVKGELLLGAAVRSITQDKDGVTLESSSVSVRARRAIVAIPPTLAGRLDYSPALPADRDQLTQRVPQGSVIKCLAVYDEPFWRKEGLTGQSISELGPCHLTFDASPAAGAPGVLLGFVEGSAARALAREAPSERRLAVLACFARVFGVRAGRPEHYVDKSWADEPWSRGCYAGYLPPGTWTSHGSALRAPIGRLHWAGTETATRWNGYIDGALESGVRAADEILGAER